jgi:two-component system, NarL family, sensor histidine kinase DegS
VSSPSDARDVVLDVVAIVGAAAERGGSIDSTLETVLERVAGGFGARLAAIYASGADGALALRAVQPATAPPAEALSPDRQPALVAALEAGRDAMASGVPGAPRELAISGLDGGVVVPARAGSVTVGALALVLPGGRALSDEERVSARAIAQIVAMELRNSQLFAGMRDRARELDRQVRQLAALTEVARGVARSLDEADAHRTIVSQARRLVRADVAVLVLRDAASGVAMAAHDGARGEVLAAAERLAVEAAEGGPLRRVREVAVPVPSADGRDQAIGAIALARAADEPFDGDDVERLGGLADHAAVALTNSRLLADLRREQDERRALAAALVLAQEEERRRVAEDLHDGPVQELTGLGLMLDALARELGGDTPAAAVDVSRAAASARESVRALRRAIFDLHPMALEELGFSAATRALVQRLEWRGVEVSLDLAAVDVLSDTQRTVAFRIVQEAIANIVRHADPATVTIGARLEAEQLVLEVNDDGRGFDPEHDIRRIDDGHLGLAAVQERAALIGGQVNIDSVEGGGTTLRLILPAPSGNSDPDR